MPWNVLEMSKEERCTAKKAVWRAGAYRVLFNEKNKNKKKRRKWGQFDREEIRYAGFERDFMEKKIRNDNRSGAVDENVLLSNGRRDRDLYDMFL